jgi:hypothetical protein
MANAHERAQLKKSEARIKDSVLRDLTEQNSSLPDTDTSQPSHDRFRQKLWSFLKSNITWGGVGVIIGKFGPSLSQLFVLMAL